MGGAALYHHHTAKTTESAGLKDNHDQEFSKSWWTKLKKGPKSAKGRPYPTNTLIDYNTFISQGLPGRLHAQINSVGFNADLVKMLRKVFAQSPPSYVSNTGVLLQPVPTAENTAIRLYLMSMEVKTEFVNFANASCILTIYEIHPKKSQDWSPLSHWSQGLEEMQGHDNAGSLVGDIQLTQYPIDSYPNESAEFKSNWDIDFQTEVYLGPGDHHIHRTLYAPHMNILSTDLFISEKGGDALTYKPGASRVLLWTIRGMPVKLGAAGIDVANENAAAGSQFPEPGTERHYLTTAACQVGVLSTKKYRFSQTDFGVKGDIDITGSMLPHIPGASQFIREEDGDEMAYDDITAV